MYRMRLSRATKRTIGKLSREDRYPKVRTGFLTDAGPAAGTVWMDPTKANAAAIYVESVDPTQKTVQCLPCDMNAADTEEFTVPVPRWLKLVAEGKLMLVGIRLTTTRTEFWGPPPWPS